MKRILFVLLLTLSSAPFASEILNCSQKANSNITYESRGKFKAESSIRENKESKITFVINKKNALLKGNAGNGVRLFKVNGETFLEDTGVNVILWKVVRSPDSKGKTYIIQAKAYDMMGPVTYSTIWDCR